MLLSGFYREKHDGAFSAALAVALYGRFCHIGVAVLDKKRESGPADKKLDS